jgi:Transglutaminase-like superfamily
VTSGSIRRWCGNAWAVGRLLPVYLALGALKHVAPVQTLARWAWRSPTRPNDPDAVRRAVARVWRTQGLVHLGDRDCLQRSLLLYRELSRLGADPTLVVGFRHAAQRTQGHAWVTTRDVVALEPDAVHTYVPVFCFGPRGELERMPADAAGGQGLS